MRAGKRARQRRERTYAVLGVRSGNTTVCRTCTQSLLSEQTSRRVQNLCSPLTGHHASPQIVKACGHGHGRLTGLV